LDELGRGRFNDVASRLQNYESSRMLREGKVQFDGGTGIQRTLLIDHSDSARSVGLYETDVVNVPELLVTMSAPWRHFTTNFAYDRRELLMNRSSERIVDILKSRRAGAMIALAELLERQVWSKPATSSDKTEMFGVPYWVVDNATEGFNGGNPAGFTAGAGGLDSDTYTRWANYTNQFTDVSKTASTGMIHQMRTMFRKIRFKSPVNVNDYRNGTGDQYKIYMSLATLTSVEDAQEGSNSNLGSDIAVMDGNTVFRRLPLTWVPYLDDNASTYLSASGATTAVYFINWAFFHFCALKDDFLRESEPAKAPNQHNVFHTHVDLTGNIICTDRRCQGVLVDGG